jgi:NADH:ubiquinone oxidoreductase subunit E
MSEHRRLDFKKQHFVGEEGRLIPLLQRAQETDGYITRERIARSTLSVDPASQIYGVTTFYAQFRLHPVGKNLIRVCHGTACHVSGANDITKAIEDTLGVCNGETTPDRLFTIETVSCLGCCSLAPVIMVNHTTHGNLTEKEVKKVLKQYQKAAIGEVQ